MRKGPVIYSIDGCEHLSVTTPFTTIDPADTSDSFPMISVLIPTYNRKNFLPITLRSILAQTFRDFEVLIMDDGSAKRADEEICQVVKEFPGSENQIRYFTQANSGPAVARNRLITAAKGKYIMFFDDDDVMLPNALQELFGFAEQHKGQRIVYCNYERIDEHGNVIGISQKVSQLPSGYLTEAIFKRTIVSTITVMIPRELLLKTKIFFHPELRIFEDTYFFLELSAHAEFAALNKILIQRRRHSAHTSTGKNAYFQLQAMQQLYHEPGMAERISKKVADFRFAKQYYRSAKEAGDLLSKINFLKQALKYNRSAKFYFSYLFYKTCYLFSGQYLENLKTVFLCLYRDVFRPSRTIRLCIRPQKKLRSIEDKCSILLVEKLSGKRISPYVYSFIGRMLRYKNYVCSGSKLSDVHNVSSVVWGTGAKPQEVLNKDRFAKILAVRGPLTRTLLLQAGIDCPEICGDPAVLLPAAYSPAEQEIKYKVGLIPDDRDADRTLVNYYRRFADIKVFDRNDLSSIEGFIDRLHQCETIVSSSLYGCIIADAYNIPNLWAKFDHDANDIAIEQNLTVDDVLNNIFSGKTDRSFDFLDYFLSCRKQTPVPLMLTDTRYRVDDLKQIVNEEWEKPDTTIYGTLLNNFPFHS